MSDPITFKSGGCGSGNCACKAGALRNERGPMDDTDYGTPLRHSDVDVTLEIDGQMISVPAGTSVMRAAAEAGVNIPKLCATDSLEPFGSCRLCLVQIEGMRGLPASCTTLVSQGMKVTTQNPKLGEIRRGVMELYLSDHSTKDFGKGFNGGHGLLDLAAA